MTTLIRVTRTVTYLKYYEPDDLRALAHVTGFNPWNLAEFIEDTQPSSVADDLVRPIEAAVTWSATVVEV